MARGVFLAAAASLALAACASTPENAPAWYAEREAQTRGDYPQLRDVPRDTIANTDAGHWATVEAEVMAAGQALKTNPRAEPAQPQDPNAFVEEARQDIEEARQAHPD